MALFRASTASNIAKGKTGTQNRPFSIQSPPDASTNNHSIGTVLGVIDGNVHVQTADGVVQLAGLSDEDGVTLDSASLTALAGVAATPGIEIVD